MFNLKNALLWAVPAVCLAFSTVAGENEHLLAPYTYHSTNLELKPSPFSKGYQLAAATFLPEFKDSEFGWTVIRPDGPNVDFCKDYPLTSCPNNAECSDCPTNKSYHKLLRCKNGFQNQGNSCIASTCQASGYEASVPTNQICTKITQGGLTCYKDCRSISCAGYTLDCDNFNVSNSNSKETCPDCSSSGSNCSPKLCKVSSCQNGYKIADNGTTCVALDDTCPNGYYKECETGTEGDPEYTEKGTACYMCKAKPQTCKQFIEENLSDYIPIANITDLSKAIADGKKKLVMIGSSLKTTADLNLSNITLMGASALADKSLLCTNTPQIEVSHTITTNDATVLKNLNFINNPLDSTSKKQNEKPMINGSGQFSDIDFSVKQVTYPNSTALMNNYYRPHIDIQGNTTTLTNISAKGLSFFYVRKNSNVIINGNMDIKRDSISSPGTAFKISDRTQITVSDGAKVNLTKPTNFIDDLNYGGNDSIININGSFNVLEDPANTQNCCYKFIELIGTNITANLNYPNDYRSGIYISGTSGESYNIVNINAATILDADNYQGIVVKGGNININAPLTIQNTDDNYLGNYPDNMLIAHNVFVNSDLTFDKKSVLVYFSGMSVSKVTLTFGSQANVKGLGRIFASHAKYDSGSTTISVKTGAKVQMGGICKKATSNKSITISKQTIDWQTPPSDLLAGGC